MPYRAELVEVFSGAGQKPEFLALSPAGKIPAIRDEDTGAVVYESNAILIYLAEKSGKLMPREGAKRAAMWQALMSASTDITPTIGSIFAVQRSKEPHAASERTSAATTESNSAASR